MADLKVKVGVDKSGFTTGLASMENSVKGFGNKVGGILAGAFAFDKIIQGFSNAIEKGDQLQDLANRFGIAASSLQEIGNAASLSGAGLEDVASAMNKLAKNAGEAVSGNDAMAEAFAKIGLSVTDLNGMSPQNLFMALSKAVASGSLGMQDFSVAMQLAGKGAGSLMETLRMGPDAIATNGQAMGVWADETIAQLSAASDAMKEFQNQGTIILGGLAVLTVPLIKGLQGVMEAFTMLGAAGARALTGDLKGAQSIIEGISQSAAQKGFEEMRNKKLGNTPRNIGDDSDGLSRASNKAFEKSEQAAARHELKLIESQISGKEEAEKMKAAIEEKYRQRSLDREVEMEKKKNEQKTRLQDLLAKEGGPQAEMALLESRAQDAAKAFKDMPSTDTATALAEARGALGAAFAQQINDQPSAATAPKGFAESEAQRRLKEQGLGADLTGFAQKTDMSRPLEKLPDMAANLVAASKTLDQILEEIKKGDGSVFR